MSDESGPAEPAADDITSAMIAAAEALAGRPATSEAHRALMAKSLKDLRGRLQTLRTSPLAAGQSPAPRFVPLAPPTRETAAAGRGLITVVSAAGEPPSLAFSTVAELAELVRSRRVTSRQLTEMYLARLKRYGGDLRCVVNLVPDAIAFEQASRADAEIAAGRYRGPLHGIPYGVKDLFATSGLPTTFGAKPYESQHLPDEATVVRRLEDAGAILLAKLSMGELAMGDVWFGGLTRNPWSPETGASGSSAGSASAVAAGLVAFALGTETWGSIISPSTVCGVTGLRPTFGRVSRHGAMPLSWSMDKVGPMCRSVADCALVLAAIAGPDGLDRSVAENTPPFLGEVNGGIAGLRIGIDVAGFDQLTTREKLKPLLPQLTAAVRTLERLTGTPLIPVQLPAQNPAYGVLPGLIIGVEGAASFASLIADGGLDALEQQEQKNWPNLFRVAATVPATEYVQAQRIRSQLQHAFAEATEDVDIYVTVPRTDPSLAYTNLTGHPEIVTRCGRTAEGMPVSLSFVGSLFEEDALLRVAHLFEQTMAMHREWPTTYPDVATATSGPGSR